MIYPHFDWFSGRNKRIQTENGVRVNVRIEIFIARGQKRDQKNGDDVS